MLTRLRRTGRTRREPVLVIAREKPEKFADVYLVYRDEILRFFARQTLDPEIAFQLMAETFATAFDDIRHFRGATDEEGLSWLLMIATGKLTPWRQRGVLDRRKLSKFGITPPNLGLEEFERIEEYAELQRFKPAALAQALQTLPPDQRDLLQFRLSEGQSYKRIATTLDSPSDEIRRQASCALRQLAVKLEQLGALSQQCQPVSSRTRR